MSTLYLAGRKSLMLFSGRAYPELADEIASYVGVTTTEMTARDFANGETFRRRVLQFVAAADTPVRWVVVAGEPITDVDTTAQDSLKELIRKLHERGIVFAMAEVKHPIYEHLVDYGVVQLVGEENFYQTVGSAVRAFVRATGVGWVDWVEAGIAPLDEWRRAPDDGADEPGDTGR